MKVIHAEGIAYTYFALHDVIPSKAGLGISNLYRDLDAQLHEAPIILTQHSVDLRIVLSKTGYGDRTGVFFLHWNDNSDLIKLDQRVADGSYTDDDFRYSLLTEHRATGCIRGCNYVWDTLIFYHDYYSGLMKRESIQLKLAERPNPLCPNCKTNLTHNVVKFITPNPITISLGDWRKTWNA